jgi:hypothetical protein
MQRHLNNTIDRKPCRYHKMTEQRPRRQNVARRGFLGRLKVTEEQENIPEFYC